jgi:hypothetical protein
LVPSVNTRRFQNADIGPGTILASLLALSLAVAGYLLG